MAINECQMILDTLFEGVIMVDIDRKITFWNLGAKRITGFSSEETIGTLCYDDVLNHIDTHGRMLCLDGCPLRQSMIDGKVREMAIYIQHKNGYRIPVILRTVPILENGIITGSMDIFIENTESNRYLDTIEKKANQSLVDSLTHLPNRTMIEHMITSKLIDFNTLEIPFGIALVDLDNFESINQTYGVNIGDEVLKLLSESFKHCFKSAEVIGRWDNDAFIFCFANLSKEEFTMVCDKIRIVSEGSVLRNASFKTIDFSVSIGGSLARQNDDLQILLNRAHEHLIKAKIKGGNNSFIK